MPAFTDSEKLTREQYNNADKLAARALLHQRFNTNPTPIQEWFFDLLIGEVTSNKAHILEVGAGRGDLWKFNEARLPDGWQVTFTDISPGMLDSAREYLGDLAKRFAFDTVDIQDLSRYVDNQFDAVIANMMLFHVADRPRAFSEVRRVLKPGGVFLAMCNGDTHMLDVFTLGRAYDPDAEKVKPDGFAQTFSLQNGIHQLTPYFQDVQIVRFDCDLWVTEPDLLIDYIETMVIFNAANIRANADALRADIQARIDRDGGIRINKDTGVFVAQG